MTGTVAVAGPLQPPSLQAWTLTTHSPCSRTSKVAAESVTVAKFPAGKSPRLGRQRTSYEVAPATASQSAVILVVPGSTLNPGFAGGKGRADVAEGRFDWAEAGGRAAAGAEFAAEGSVGAVAGAQATAMPATSASMATATKGKRCAAVVKSIFPLPVFFRAILPATTPDETGSSHWQYNTTPRP